VTVDCADGGGGERDGAAVDSDPAAATVAWERRRERRAQVLFDGSPRRGLTAMAERRARRSGSLRS
jgi:hypothetical protein